MFNTYVKEPSKKKQDNPFFTQLVVRIGRKFNVIRGEKNGQAVVLYDVQTKMFHRGKTHKFIAQQANRFIRKIPLANIEGENANRVISARQIRKLQNDNSGWTSVNSIIILCVMFQLLQMDINSPEFKKIIHEDAVMNSEFSEYVPALFISGHLKEPKNCACYFLGEKVRRILEEELSLPHGQMYLADYICACSDKLDEIVTKDAYDAIRIGAGFPEKKLDFKDISPNQFPDYPGHESLIRSASLIAV